MHNQINNLSVIELDRVLALNNINPLQIPLEFKLNYIEVIGEYKYARRFREESDETIRGLQQDMRTLREQQNITNQGLANLGAGLNALDARVTLTEQNLNLLKDRVNTIAEQAIRNGQIPNPVKPREGEEALLKNILGDQYYQNLKLNYMIVTRDEIAKAAKEVINQAILACKITNVISEERANYRTREENTNKVAREGQRIEQETEEVENGLQNLDSNRAAQRGRIADSVRRGQVTNASLVSYDQQTEEMRTDLEDRRKKIRSDADLHEKDVEKLESEFVSTLRRIGANGSYVKEIVELAGVAISVANSIEKYVEKKEAQTRQEERFKIRANQLEQELIAMTTDRKKETFEKVNAIYLARYYVTYDRSDQISFKIDHSAFPNRMSEKCGYRSFSGIPHFKEFLSYQSILIGKAEEYLKQVLTICSRDELIDESTQPPIARINNQDYYFSFVVEDKKEEFKIKYQLYRALMKIGEFDEIKECGDKNKIKRALFYSLIPVFWVDGLYIARDRSLEETFWKRNIPNLKEVMKMYLVVAERLEDILKTKCSYARLKYYNDWIKSEHGTNLLEKNEKVLNSEFPNDEAKEKFEQCFDLYQKISNEGKADRYNYVNYTFEYATAAILLARQQAAQRVEAAT